MMSLQAFGIMDTDKDGLLSASDLTAAFAAHGKQIGGGEAQVNITVAEMFNEYERRKVKAHFWRREFRLSFDTLIICRHVGQIVTTSDKLAKFKNLLLFTACDG